VKNVACDPGDIALKAHFLGPQSENIETLAEDFQKILKHWSAWRRKLHENEGSPISSKDQQEFSFAQAVERTRQSLEKLMRDYSSEIPMYSPHFVSHMVSETSIPSVLGHFLALLHNPNNVTRDSSSVGLGIETEAVAMIAQMLGFRDPVQVRGHFTSGGTVANFEALSRALKRQMMWMWEALRSGEELSLQKAAHSGWSEAHPQKDAPMSLLRLADESRLRWSCNWVPRIFVPMSAHYSWEKAVSLMGLGSESLIYVPLNSEGRMDVAEFKRLMALELAAGSTIVAVVSLAGSTEMGTIDSIDLIQDHLDELKQEQGLDIWHHVDAAYGGFLACCPRNDLTEPWYDGLHRGVRRVNSVTIDPHKLGYVPYAAGVVLIRDPRDYYLFSPGAPYLAADAVWPGAQTLEGSRAATGPTAFWMSAKSIGLNEEGYGRLLVRTLKQRALFQEIASKDDRFVLLPGCDTNLALFALSSKRGGVRCLSDFEDCVEGLMRKSQEGHFDYRLSMTSYSLKKHQWLQRFLVEQGIELDREELKALRVVFMNPFLDTKESRVRHIEKLFERLQEAL
jgi:glutamate/tyrosine decarboxylase-like PLP-dependent enzyme